MRSRALVRGAAGLALALPLACAPRLGLAFSPRPDYSATSVEVRSGVTRTGIVHRQDSLGPFAMRRVAEGVYVVPGDTGRGSEGRPNAGFVVTEAEVVVIDALGSPVQGERLLRAIRTVTALPVRWVILTHHHPDHHFGAVVFRRAGARVIAHPDRRTLAAEAGDEELVSAWTEVVGAREMSGFEFADTPDVPVSRDTTLQLGSTTIAISHPGPAHTPGDLLVWLPKARVLFAGDLLIEDGVTMIVDGNSQVLLDALTEMDALGARIAVPGHGRISEKPRALTQLTRCYVHEIRAEMRDAVTEGVPMGRALNQLPPADPDRPVSRPSRERRNALRVYLEMEREVMQFDSGSGDAGTEVLGSRADGQMRERPDSARKKADTLQTRCDQ